jgi:hypothetical protein
MRTMSTRASAAIGLASAALGMVVAYSLLIRPWHLTWGATRDEARRSLPGDDLVANAVLQSTRAITIAAAPEAVWPWIAQLGQGRGGFYSHTFFQNLLRSDIDNADRIIPDLQDIRVGDTIWLASPRNLGQGAPHFHVVQVVPGRAMVVCTPPSARETVAVEASWAFILAPLGSGATRLLVRYRSFSEPAWLASTFSLEPLAFLMERRMLLGIRERAERQAARDAPVAPIGDEMRSIRYP